LNILPARKKLFVWGASGHARFVLNILKFYDDIEVVGIIDDVSPERAGEIFDGIKIWGGRESLPLFKSQGVNYCIFGFGNCSARLKLSDLLLIEGFELFSAIHPDATIASNVSIGAGTVVGPGVVIDAGCEIHANCILNNSCCISHGSIIGSGTHICPGVTIGGDVTIGSGSWIGIGSTVIQKIAIGSGSYIGAGAVVTKDIQSNVLAHGIPAKIIRAIPPEF